MLKPYFGLGSRVNDLAFLGLASGFPICRAELAPGFLCSPYQRFYGWCSSRKRGRGQFLQTREPEALQERFGCRKAQAAVGASEFLHKLEIAKFQRMFPISRISKRNDEEQTPPS